MPATTVPILSENSIVCWELEATRRVAPAAATWRAVGKLTQWADLGPKNSVFRDIIAGAGREAATIGHEGATYDEPLGPFQVVDPLILGMAWGEEVSAPVIIGGGPYYRHTVTPTTNGQLPSMSLQMRDVQGGAAAVPVTDRTTFMETIVRRLALRGEMPGDDGSGGRLLATLDLMAHDDDDSVVDKAVTLPTTEPYRYHHGVIQGWGEQLFRVEDWEFILDNQAKYNFYWRDDSPRRASEAPPEGALYDFNATIIADGEKFTTGGSVDRLLREVSQERLLGNATLSMTRTTNQDEFDVNLTDLAIVQALKQRSTGGGSKVKYLVQGHVRASSLNYVDQSSTRFFPS